ncbi:MAG: hypothetical protein KDB66_04215 [Solirubrobacterales bacterium]|nr:hypothetical protein [Solirubrobacterales bacterium]MCB8916163.1 hypothetical protein [Thermoleophilales bacterium]
MPTTRFDLRRLTGTVIAVSALSLGLAACGGGDDEETTAPVATTTTTDQAVVLTQDDLISQGDDICAEANSALGSIETSTADETTKSSQIADIYDGIAQQLGDLGTPSDGDPPTDVIAAAQDLADGSGDTTAFTTAAGAYGFTDCAQAPEATSYPTDSTGTDSTSTGTDSTGTYVPPTTTPDETYTPPTTTTPPVSTGGGVAPTTPSTGGGTSTGGSSGGASSGGIGPG